MKARPLAGDHRQVHLPSMLSLYKREAAYLLLYRGRVIIPERCMLALTKLFSDCPQFSSLPKLNKKAYLQLEIVVYT